MIIDDSSNSIVYSGQWTTGGNEQEYNNSAHGSWTKDSKATIVFTGQSIQVYGTIGREHSNGDPAFAPISEYMIDGQNDSTKSFTGDPSTDILYKQRFYQSPKLSNGQHQLVVTLITSDMNTMWIDYFVVEAPARISHGLIAGVVAGGVVGIALLVTIGILWRRISRMKRQRVRYEKLSPKVSHTYWPWMSSSPGKLTPFGSDPLSDTRPRNGTLRPFSVQYTPYSPDSLVSPGLSNETSLSGYTVRGDTAADKTTTRESTTTNYTSLSGYTIQGGTSAEKIASTSTSDISQSATNRLNTSGNTSLSPRHTVQGTSRKDNRSSRPSSGTSAGTESHRKELPSSTNTSCDARPRPFVGTTTNRVVAEGEDVPPAYSINIRSNPS